MTINKNLPYEAPLCEVLTTAPETVLCQSSNGETTPYTPGDNFQW